jgi:hypothetical protein
MVNVPFKYRYFKNTSQTQFIDLSLHHWQVFHIAYFYEKQNKTQKNIFLLGTYFLLPHVCFLPDPRYSLETYTPSLSSLESTPRPSPESDQGPQCPRFLESLSMIYLSSYNALMGGKPKQMNLSYLINESKLNHTQRYNISTGKIYTISKTWAIFTRVTSIIT